MTVSPYVPDVVVEIAFDSGYNTPSWSRTWTDISEYVEARDDIKITHGRQDEFSTTEANRLSLTLDNKDGRFTAGKTDGAYYPNIKIGRPIRVKATPVGGAESVRFVGYIDEWPVEWNGSDAYAAARITASSRMARLGFDSQLRSIIEEQYLADDPVAYYTMADPAGSTSASDSSTHNAGPLTAGGPLPAVVFGSATGPSTDSLTAASFNAGQHLTGDMAIVYAAGSGTAGSTVEAFFLTSTLPTDTTPILSLARGAYYSAGTISVLPSGKLFGSFRAGVGSFFDVTSVGSVADGRMHHAALTFDDATFTLSLYLDGALVGTALADNSEYGGRLRVGEEATSGFDPFTGTIAHVAVYNDCLSADRILAHSDAGLLGWSADTASERIGRLASFAGIPSAEYAGDAGTNPVADFDTTGSTAIDNMRTVETTEGGVLFDGRDNTLTFHGRAHRYSTASAFTLDVTLQEVESGIAPKLDRSALVNDVTATASDGSTARAINQESVVDYGFARATLDIASSNEVALQAASWQVNIYGEPQPRIPSLGVDLLPLSQARQDSLLTLDIGSKITLSNLPSQAQASTVAFFVEGYTETISAGSYAFDFNVSPTAGFDVWKIEDPVFGAIESYPIAF